jgi:hypothetical protein
MDVTFRELEPYYVKPWDLDPFLEEFSLVTESDSREGENEGADTQEEVIVGIILCPMDRSGTEEDNSVGVRNGECEDEEIVGGEVVGDGNVETIDEGSEENGGSKESGVRGIVAKEPTVDQRRWFRSQGSEQLRRSQLCIKGDDLGVRGSKLVHHSHNSLFHQSQISPRTSLH